MQTLTATYRIVTPLFLGGANPNDHAKLREPSIKAALRFWWRTNELPSSTRGFWSQLTSIEALAHLGPRAFAETDGEAVNTALFVLAKEEPPPDLRLTAFRFVGPKSPEEKDALLRAAIPSLVGKAAADGPRRKKGGVMKPAETRTWRCKALTGIWTGDADGRAERLITTGLLGSIRWWIEVVVRGLGGGACDPSQTKCQDRKHCAVCELFGCTGWARKFRFDVVAAGGEIQEEQIKAGDPFALRFTPLRPVREEEWALLDLTLRLIADYGAIGGKTVLKPSDETSRKDRPNHKDYGLFEVEHRPNFDAVSSGRLRAHAGSGPWRRVDDGELAWASAQQLWVVNGRYLARQNTNGSTFNRVLGRKEPKNQGQTLRNSPSPADKWLAGRQRESKKVFSFKNPPRTFGFVKPGVVTFDDMRSRLKGAWPALKHEDLIEGPAVLERLLGSGTAGTP